MSDAPDTATFRPRLDDATLLSQFRSCALPREDWTHEAHLRVAYLFLESLPEAAALDAIRSGIKALNRAHGAPETPTRGYHETITRFWFGVVAEARRVGGPWPDSHAFLASHSELLEPGLIRRHYSAELLREPRAKGEFVGPDVWGGGGA